MSRPTLLRPLALRLFVIALALATSSCGRFREISACRGVAKDVNAALDEIEALSKKPSPEQELRMAQRYSELVKRLEPRTQGSTPMATALREYVAILRAAETALRNHAEASKSQGSARMNETRRELERLLKREKASVTRLDVECHS